MTPEQMESVYRATPQRLERFRAYVYGVTGLHLSPLQTLNIWNAFYDVSVSGVSSEQLDEAMKRTFDRVSAIFGELTVFAKKGL